MISKWLNNIRLRIECQKFSAQLNEYVDGSLDPGLMWRINNHSAVCTSCRDTITALSSVVRMLSGAERREVSGNFDAALALRIAAADARSSQIDQTNTSSAAKRTSPRIFSRAPFRAVGAFALAAAFMFCAFVMLKPTSAPVSPATGITKVSPSSDVAALGVLVDQHRQQQAADPLSDPSAQLLASTVDTIKVDPSKNHNLSDADAAVMLDEEM